MCMYVFACAYVHMSTSVPSGAGLTGVCEAPNMGARNWILILGKSNTLDHWISAPVLSATACLFKNSFCLCYLQVCKELKGTVPRLLGWFHCVSLLLWLWSPAPSSCALPFSSVLSDCTIFFPDSKQLLYWFLSSKWLKQKGSLECEFH